MITKPQIRSSKVEGEVGIHKITVLKASHHGRKSGYYGPAVKEMSPWLTITLREMGSFLAQYSGLIQIPAITGWSHPERRLINSFYRGPPFFNSSSPIPSLPPSGAGNSLPPIIPQTALLLYKHSHSCGCPYPISHHPA